MRLRSLVLAMACVAPVSQAEIFISEYIEGASYNKAIEFYNPTDTSVDLTAYTVKLYFNGNLEASRVISLEGALAGESTYVIAHSSAADEIVAQLRTSSLSYNGDDVVALYKGDVLIDSLGKLGEDPGSEWGSGDQSTKDNTLVRVENALLDNNLDDEFDPAAQWIGYPKDTFSHLGSHNGNGSGEPPVDPEPPEPLTCVDETIMIHQVQGNTSVSPMVGQTAIVEGVVTAVWEDQSAVIIQEEAADQDDDAMTSEGIWLQLKDTAEFPLVGSVVKVRGIVKEFYNKTELEVEAGDLLTCGSATFSAVPVTLPFASEDHKEALEGMYVSLAQTLTVTSNYSLGRYGEVTLSNGRLFQPTSVHLPGSAEATALAQTNALNQIILDDLSNGSNPEVIKYPAPELSAANTLRTGDTFSNVEGIMDYSFSAYRILPMQEPSYNRANPRPEALSLPQAGNLRVASFNVLNFFNGDGQQGGFPTSRGASNYAEFERQAAKTVNAILDIDADVIGLNEMENDGYDEFSAHAELVSRLNAVAGEGTYDFVRYDGQLGGDAVMSGIIYKPGQVELVGPSVSFTGVPFDYGNRPSLVQAFAQKATGERFIYVINHLRAKRSCSSADEGNRDSGDGQGCWNQTRVDATNVLLDWLATDPTGTGEKDILFMGDMNAYAMEDPIRNFEARGLTNLVKQFEGEYAYSYQFSGMFGYLDHALATASLTRQVTDVVEWKVNADEPVILDYNTEYKSDKHLVSLYDESPYRASDHDPVVIELALNTETLIGDMDQDGDIDKNDISAFARAVLSGQALGEEFDFNQDGQINTLDVRLMYAMCTNAG